VVTTAAPVASYADASPHPAPSASGSVIAAPLDWPGLARPGWTPASHPPSVATPARPSAALVTAPARRQRRTREDIVVRAGDSLWTLTARRLGPGASGAEIAAAWPRLYAANRAVIGTDPGLIHPGQRLVPPAAETRSPR
jgi:nucleoid-associated protein YgaU